MSNPMNQVAASRIQSATAKTNNGLVAKGAFASRAQSTAARNAPANGPSQTGKHSGGGRGNNVSKGK